MYVNVYESVYLCICVYMCGEQEEDYTSAARLQNTMAIIEHKRERLYMMRQVIHCNTLECTATHCNTLQHTDLCMLQCHH